MKSIIALGCILCAFACFAQTDALPYAAPLTVDADVVDLAKVDADFPVEVDDLVNHNRQKRATCDLLSFTNSNHSACAAHCLLRGKRGGYCNNQAICVCRN